jgi:hypothetical protein
MEPGDTADALGERCGGGSGGSDATGGGANTLKLLLSSSAYDTGGVRFTADTGTTRREVPLLLKDSGAAMGIAGGLALPTLAARS